VGWELFIRVRHADRPAHRAGGDGDRHAQRGARLPLRRGERVCRHL
jgi:hypothetical protein